MEAENKRQKGNEAESMAREFLKNRGFEIIESNFYARYGEIDIIAKKDSIYHFIEVKSGKNFNPIQNITPKKLEKIILSISLYLAKNELNVAYCIDVITIKNNRIDFFENVSL